MQLIQSMSEVGEAINRAKADASAYSSNFYPAPKKLQGWISHSELFYELRDGAVFFLRRDRDFWHFYFCAANPESLKLALAAFPLLRAEPVVADLVGQKPALGDLADALKIAGFKCYNRLFRMCRPVTAQALSCAEADPRIVIAEKADHQPILEMLLRSFDSRAEQIPMPYEIEAAVAAGQIFVARSSGALAGLLFFETQGLTSTLRYWLIAPEFRMQRFGSSLMHHYFSAHPSVRRFLLWVIADNDNAIAKYKHYGFAPDGLVDQVFANEMIRP